MLLFVVVVVTIRLATECLFYFAWPVGSLSECCDGCGFCGCAAALGISGYTSCSASLNISCCTKKLTPTGLSTKVCIYACGWSSSVCIDAYDTTIRYICKYIYIYWYVQCRYRDKHGGVRYVFIKYFAIIYMYIDRDKRFNAKPAIDLPLQPATMGFSPADVQAHWSVPHHRMWAASRRWWWRAWSFGNSDSVNRIYETYIYKYSSKTLLFL